MIWCNENICYKRRYLYNYNWIKKGILYISDVIDENGHIKSYQTLARKVGESASNLMYYNVIVNAVRCLRLSPGLNSGILIQKKTNNRMLNRYIASVDAPEIACQSVWEDTFQSTLNWPEIWKLPFRVSRDTKSREIQWKILHRIYPTNVYLCKIRIRNTDICEQCSHNVADTLEHFFATCKTVLVLWKHIENIASAYYSKRIVLTVKDKLLGHRVDEPLAKFDLLNKLIMVAKVSISKFKKSAYPNLLFLFELECRLRHYNYMYRAEK